VATLRRVPEKEMSEQTRPKAADTKAKKQPPRKPTPAEEAAARQRARLRSGEDD
jgi:hypothetical protein